MQPPYDASMASAAVSKKVTPSALSKKKSKFKKCPQAPKRFKSAYIFFSTDMMQRIKAQQKGSEDEKQKITDISKQISNAWKELQPKERAKWNLIAKKDKDRYLEEKKNYKGPWQLPVKQGQDECVATTNATSLSSLSESDEEDQKSLNFNLTKRSDCDATKADVKESYPQQKFDKVSQAERDAAHNLVQLHLFGTINNKNSSNNVISSDNHSETTSTSSYSMPESRGYNMRMNQYLPKPEILLAQRMISTLSPFPPIHPSHLFRQEIQQQLMHAPTSVQGYIDVQRSPPQYFKFSEL